MTFKLKVFTKGFRFPTIPVIFSNFHRTGDQILEVNDEDLSKATQEYAASILKTTQGIAIDICYIQAQGGPYQAPSTEVIPLDPEVLHLHH